MGHRPFKRVGPRCSAHPNATPGADEETLFIKEQYGGREVEGGGGGGRGGSLFVLICEDLAKKQQKARTVGFLKFEPSILHGRCRNSSFLT